MLTLMMLLCSGDGQASAPVEAEIVADGGVPAAAAGEIEPAPTRGDDVDLSESHQRSLVKSIAYLTQKGLPID